MTQQDERLYAQCQMQARAGYDRRTESVFRPHWGKLWKRSGSYYVSYWLVDILDGVELALEHQRPGER